jgi:hypothetical protein
MKVGIDKPRHSLQSDGFRKRPQRQADRSSTESLRGTRHSGGYSNGKESNGRESANNAKDQAPSSKSTTVRSNTARRKSIARSIPEEELKNASVIDSETIPEGCLTDELTQALFTAGFRDNAPEEGGFSKKNVTQSLMFLVFVFFPASLAALASSVPLTPIKDGPSINLVAFTFACSFVCGIGMSHKFCFLVKLEISWKRTLLFTLTHSCLYTTLFAVFGNVWYYPVPLGYLWIGTLGMQSACVVTLIQYHGLKKLQTWAIVSKTRGPKTYGFQCAL